MRRTKIVATLGPVSDSPEMIERLIQSGVNVFRLNAKHADKNWHSERIERIRAAMFATKLPIGILIDLQGPEIRLELADGKEKVISKGEVYTFSLHADPEGKNIMLPTPEVFDAITPGQRLLIDDGSIEFDIIETGAQSLSAIALQDCLVKHRKSVNFPGVDIKLPSLIERDYDMLSMANIKEVDFVALSFTRTREDVQILRDELKKRGLSARIVSKIENQIALNNLSEIIDASDAIMVARGDLAVETPMEQLIYWQKHIIMSCRKKGKPVIAATQMLHSMVHNARPTRAEISDVSNAVYDGTDCVMLSEETAGGDHPLLVIQTMDKIVSYNETVAIPPVVTVENPTLASNTAHSAFELLTAKQAEKISSAIVLASNVDFLQHLSMYRIHIPIIALCADSNVRRYLRMSYGIIAPKLEIEKINRENMAAILTELKEKGIIHAGETVYLIDEVSDTNSGVTSTQFSYLRVS